MSANNLNDWPDFPPDLASLDREIADAFHVERALFAVDMRERVMARLPRMSSAAVRVARMLSAVILLGSFGLLGLTVQLMAARYHAWNPQVMVQVIVGLGAVLVAALVALAGPRLVDFEYRLLGRAPASRSMTILMTRAVAVATLILGALWIV